MGWAVGALGGWPGGRGGPRVPSASGKQRAPRTASPIWKTSDFVVVSLHQQQVPVCRMVWALAAGQRWPRVLAGSPAPLCLLESTSGDGPGRPWPVHPGGHLPETWTKGSPGRGGGSLRCYHSTHRGQMCPAAGWGWAPAVGAPCSPHPGAPGPVVFGRRDS